MSLSNHKLLFITPSLQKIGGVQNYTKNFIKASESSGHFRSVKVVSIREQDSSSKVSIVNKLRFLIAVLISALLYRPDAIVASHASLGALAKLAGRLSFSRFTVLTYGFDVWGDLPDRSKAALGSASRVLTMSEFTKTQLVDTQGVAPERIRVLPGTFTSVPGSSTDESSLPIILTVARLDSAEQYKGHDTIIRSMPTVLKSVPDAKYVIVGEGDDRDRLSSLADSLGIAEKVAFEGAVDDESLQSWYSRCGVFAMPARTSLNPSKLEGEGFGIVYVEAMIAGKPVIAPNVGAPAEIIEDGVDGLLVTPDNEVETATAIVSLFDGTVDARAMGENARRKAQLKYSPSVFGESTKQIWNEYFS